MSHFSDRLNEIKKVKFNNNIDVKDQKIDSLQISIFNYPLKNLLIALEI